MFLNKIKNIRKKKQTQQPSFNPYFLYDIEPKGNILFDEKFIRKGDGYEACIHIYEYPTMVYDFWLLEIVNRPNIVVTIDIASAPMDKIRQDINNSLSEDLSRMYTDTENVAVLDAHYSYQSLQDLYNNIKQSGEVIKLVHTRIYASERTPEELHNTVKEIQEELDGLGYRNAVYLNETEYEWRAMFTPYHQQLKHVNKREGNPIPATALAGGYPFYFTALMDANGMYIGDTKTGGTVVFDQFHKSEKRLSYDLLVIGNKGSGKSTLLKKLTRNNAVQGNFVRLIDVEGEFTSLVQQLGGVVIGLDANQGRMNYLDVLKTDENEQVCFNKHLSKMNMLYRFLNPEATTEECNEFENIVRGIYVEMGLWGGDNATITGLPPEIYPTFSDLLIYIRTILYEDMEKKIVAKRLTTHRAKRLETIELIIENLVQNYGNLLDGHSTIQNISTTPIVSFDIRSLSSIKSEVFNAIMFNILNLFWDNMYTVGLPEKAKFDNGETDLANITKYSVVIDESHKIVNTNNEMVLDFVLDFVRQMRKYFGGLTLASQFIYDYFPKGGSSAAEDKMRTIFALTQYKFIMQQGSSALEHLKQVFENEITDSQLKDITKYGKGDCLLMNNGMPNLELNIKITDAENALYKGGA